MAQPLHGPRPMPAKKKKPTPTPPAPIRIGCVPLADTAPLVAAHALGIFADHGITVDLSWELGWAAIREGLHYRQFDCAHAPAGLVFAMRSGTTTHTTPVFAPFIFSLHGNALTLSTSLWKRGIRDAPTLAKYIRPHTTPPLTFAAVSRYSSHYFLLRTWLTSAGLHPDRDVRLTILPPRLMPECLAAGLIDGFCAGEPWNTLAIRQGTGWSPALSSELAPGHPEKALLVHETFAHQSPDRLHPLLAALTQAAAWCDTPANRPKLTTLLANTGHFPDRTLLEPSLCGPFPDGTGQTRDASHFFIFHRQQANHPLPQRGQWVLDQLIHHGSLPPHTPTTPLLTTCWHPAI